MFERIYDLQFTGRRKHPSGLSGFRLQWRKPKRSSSKVISRISRKDLYFMFCVLQHKAENVGNDTNK